MDFKTKYKDLFGEVYLFMQRHYPPTGSDTYWRSLLNDASELHKNRPTQFTKDLIMTVIDELEREEKTC